MRSPYFLRNIKLRNVMSAGQGGWQADRCWPLLTVSPTDVLSQLINEGTQESLIRETVGKVIQSTLLQWILNEARRANWSKVLWGFWQTADHFHCCCLSCTYLHTNEADCRGKRWKDNLSFGCPVHSHIHIFSPTVTLVVCKHACFRFICTVLSILIKYLLE